MEAIILAGGLGTRLALRLEGIPKAMAPIAGRPFLEILLTQLQRAGCTRAILSVGHLHTAIRDHFGTEFNALPIDYVIENQPLGTGGAIRKALEAASEDSVLAMNGDTFLQIDYAAMLRFHAEQAAPFTLAVTHQPNIARYGGVLIHNSRITGYQEKGSAGPGFINAGVYALPKQMPWPPALPEKFSFEVDFLAPQISALTPAALKPAAYQVNGFFLDIGIPEDLDRAQTELVNF